MLRPVAVARRDYVPTPARNGTINFLGNLEEPASMVNNFLRGIFTGDLSTLTASFSTQSLAGRSD